MGCSETKIVHQNSLRRSGLPEQRVSAPASTLPPECLPELLLTSWCPRHVGQDLIPYLGLAGHHGLAYPHFLFRFVGSLCLPNPSLFSDSYSPSTLSPRDCLEESALLLVHPHFPYMSRKLVTVIGCLSLQCAGCEEAEPRLSHQRPWIKAGKGNNGAQQKVVEAPQEAWCRSSCHPAPIHSLELLPSDGNMSDLGTCLGHVSCGPWQSPSLCSHPKADRACRTWEGNWEKGVFPGYEPRKHCGCMASPTGC